MEKFDVRTIFSLIFMTGILFGVLLMFFRKLSGDIKGIPEWIVSSFSAASGSLLFIFYPFPSAAINLSFANFFISGALFLYLAGLKKFNGSRVVYPVIIALPLLSFAQTIFFTEVIYNPQIRLSINAVIFSFFPIFAILEMKKTVTSSYRLIFILNGFICVVYALSWGLRAGINIVYPAETVISSTTMNIIFFMISICLQIVIFISVVVIIFIKLSDSLRSQIAGRDKFFSIIAHDLRSPVGSITAMLKQINEGVLITKDQEKEYLHELEKLSMSTLHLLNNLLEWGRSSSGGISPDSERFNIDDEIFESVRFFSVIASLKSIQLTYDRCDEAYIFADRKMISAAVRNIISNSIKFTFHGGVIQVKCRIEGSKVRISVADNGIGMPDNHIHEILNNNFIRSRRGTIGESGSGLGLVICREFILKNNGKMEIESIVKGGTTVTFVFNAA